MSVREVLRQARIARNIEVSNASAFVSIPEPSYWDLESCEDEIWNLRLIEITRLLTLLQIPPNDLCRLQKDAPTVGKDLPVVRDPFDRKLIAQGLRQSIPDLAALADLLGWETTALESSLSDDTQFGEMPLFLLFDLCKALNVSSINVLDRYVSNITGNNW